MMRKKLSMLAWVMLACSLQLSCGEDDAKSRDDAADPCADKVCGTDETCVDGECQKKGNVDPCAGKVCGTDETCVDGECQKEPGDEAKDCTEPCGEDEQCVAGICTVLPDVDKCEIVQCNEGEECVDGKCMPDPVESDLCLAKTCDTGETCVEGICVPIDVKCGGVECEDGQVCINEICEGGIPEKCGQLSHCAPDEYCENNACVKIMPDHDDDEPDPGDDDGNDAPVVLPGALIVSPTSGLKTKRSGETASFSVQLNEKPEMKITVPVKSLNTDLGNVKPASLTFTPENWDQAQTVTITGSTKATVANSKYKVQVGPLNTSDSLFKSAKQVLVEVTHVDDLVGKGNCKSGESKDDDGTCITKPVTAISMNKSYALRRGETRTLKVTVTPENATNKEMTYTLTYVNENGETKTLNSGGTVIQWTNDGAEITLTGVGKNARSVTMKVVSKSNKKLKAETTIYYKPYTKLKYGTAKTFRDFTYSCKNDNETGYDSSCKPNTAKGNHDLTCETYTKESIDVFNKDLYTQFVRPAMIAIKQSNGSYKYYGTRASVVAAARFLSIQFPYDIPYYMERGGNKIRLTRSEYVWNAKEKQDSAQKARVFGLNLSSNLYGRDAADENSISLTSPVPVVPWACDLTNYNGKKARNGFACSGFVSWAFRNGRVHLGSWDSAHLGYLKNGDKKGLQGYLANKNGNNEYDNAYARLSNIQQSDFVSLSSLTTKSKIKAGDLVWHGSKGDKSYNDGNSKFGHVGMIVRISRDKDDLIKGVYVAEATNSYTDAEDLGHKTGRTGNRIRYYQSLEQFKKDPHWSDGVTSYIIKMDHVYEAVSPKDKNGNYYKDADGVEMNGNKYHYQDAWD